MIKKIAVATSALLLSSSVLMADIYNITVTNSTTNETFSKGASSLEEIIDYFSKNQLETNFTSYNENTDNATAQLDMRGLEVNLSYVGTEIRFAVPSLGINESFNGSTRTQSEDLFEEWLEKNGAETMERIMKELARVSPVDPIAGNSNSAMAKTVEADFTQGFINTASHQKSATISVDKNKNTISIAPTYKSLDVDGKTSSSYTLPLAYSFVSNEDQNRKFTVNMPISYTEVEGAKSYNFGLGFSYSLPINTSWTLTPSIGYSIAGSVDLGTLAQIANASITSSYTFDLNENHRLSLGNMVGYYSTVKFYSGDYAYDPGIKNIVYRNALMYSTDTNDVLKNTSLDLYVINTKFTGTELYNDGYNEIGFSFGYNNVNVNVLSENEKYAYKRDVKIVASYLTSDKEKGFKVNFGFTF